MEIVDPTMAVWTSGVALAPAATTSWSPEGTEEKVRSTPLG